VEHLTLPGDQRGVLRIERGQVDLLVVLLDALRHQAQRGGDAGGTDVLGRAGRRLAGRTGRPGGRRSTRPIAELPDQDDTGTDHHHQEHDDADRDPYPQSGAPTADRNHRPNRPGGIG